MNRRDFLRGSAMTTGACVLGKIPIAGWPAPRREPNRGDGFTFAFFTDVHLEPAMDAPLGTAMAMEVINASEAEFAICGGDHVYDALGTPRNLILEQYSLYGAMEKALRVPVRHVLGNHDVAGLYEHSGVQPSDPIFGKALFQKVFNTPTYYSFQHRGVQFIVLDSIALDGRTWKPEIDAVQIAWLERVLAAGGGMPTIVITHIPLVTDLAGNGTTPGSRVYDPVANAGEVIALLEKHRVMAVLQGHIHIVENLQYRGVQFVSGGAVCGNWWKGPHFGDREGVTLVTVNHAGISTRYVPTGFVSSEPANA